MSLIFDPIRLIGLSNGTATNIFDLIERGKTWETRTALIGLTLTTIGIVAVIAANYDYIPNYGITIGISAGVAGLTALGIAMGSFEYHKSKVETEAVNALRERVIEEPAEPQLAWDLARIKLENDLDKNLKQVSSIYYLTVIVMIFSMILIGFGVYRAIDDPSTIQPSALAALTGIIVQIIGGTFLIIYRSTMAQAKDYVNVLERINAVGMSINILESIESATDMRDDARIKLSVILLSMYAPQNVEIKK